MTPFDPTDIRNHPEAKFKSEPGVFPESAPDFIGRLAWITANPWRARQVELVLADVRRRDRA